LVNLLSQTRAYVHEIAFTWCDTRDIHVGAPVNKSIGLSKHVGWQYGRDEATAARSRPSPRLNANANTLDEKGKKYGSFNPTSVNSFCPVAGGVGTHFRRGILTRPQVGDFQVAIGDEGVIVVKATVSAENMQMRMKILKIAKRLNGDRRTGFGIVIAYGLSQIKIQHFPGATAQFCEQLAVKHEIDPQSFITTQSSAAATTIRGLIRKR
jgi:hypothetical protein